LLLEGIKLIGKAELQRKPLVEALVDTQLLEQRGKAKNHTLIATLNIYLDPPELVVDAREIDEKALVEVLWVGNAAGSNSPQDRLTTNNLTYLASQTVPNLLNALPDGDLKVLLQRVEDIAYVDLGEKVEVFPDGDGDQQYERYRWVWDLRKLGLGGDLLKLLPKKDREEAEAICTQEGVTFLSREFLKEYARRKGKAVEAVKLTGKALQTWVAHKLGVKSSELKLYTLAVEGDLLVRHPAYCAYIERKLVDEAFESSAFTKGVCHLCGSDGTVTADTTRFKLLKFYITDKLGFASGLCKKGFLRTYTLCKDCYRALLAGERFVENELRTRLGRSIVYVIPVFHVPEAQPDAQTLGSWAEYSKDRLAASETIKKWHEFQQKLERYQRHEAQKAFFVFNLLFATKGQAAVKIEKLIADVPPSRFDRLDEVRNRVGGWAIELLGADTYGNWDLGLGNLFYLLPLRQRDRRPETRPYLELLDALLTGRPLSAQMLIPQFLETTRVHRFERYDQYVHTQPKDCERGLVLHMLQSQLLLRYLNELGQLQGLKGGEISMGDPLKEMEQGALEENLRAWMDGLELDSARRGLFLLGVLIGKIGTTREQRHSGKPILNKVHFQGMDCLKIARLANEVYEKLRQYKIAEYNESLYAAMKAHLDRSIEELGSPQENVYWVLSGYAYATWQAIRHGRGSPLAEGEILRSKTKEVSASE
jgi:CRISPR-associated protein Csh1